MRRWSRHRIGNDDLLIIVGLVVTGAGLYLINPALTIVLVGLAITTFGVMLAQRS